MIREHPWLRDLRLIWRVIEQAEAEDWDHHETVKAIREIAWDYRP